MTTTTSTIKKCVALKAVVKTRCIYPIEDGGLLCGFHASSLKRWLNEKGDKYVQQLCDEKYRPQINGLISKIVSKRKEDNLVNKQNSRKSSDEPPAKKQRTGSLSRTTTTINITTNNNNISIIIKDTVLGWRDSIMRIRDDIEKNTSKIYKLAKKSKEMETEINNIYESINSQLI